MKKFALYTFLSLSSALVAADVIKYEVEPTIGYNKFDNTSKMESTFVYGIRGTIYPNSYYGYRLSYERSDNVHYDESSDIKTTDLQRISGQLLVSGEEEYNVIPYLLFGGGYEILSDETNHDVSQGYVEGGIGFKYHMKNDLIFDLEGKAMKKFDTDDIDYMVTFGLGYLFDPTRKKVEIYQPGELEERKIVQPEPVTVPKPLKQREIKPAIEVSHPTTSVDAKYTFSEEIEPSVTSTQPIKSEPMSDVTPLSENRNLYFVQVAAMFHSECSKLLTQLDNRGFLYEVENATRLNKEAQLIKVGPYYNISEAKSALKDLKKIKKDAFITKRK